MQNLFVVMLVLVGVAVALFVALIALQPGGPSGLSPAETAETLIPQAIEGFKLEDISRSEPYFPGELFSVHGIFVPAEDSPFSSHVESLGISVFLLKEPKAAEEIKETLKLLGTSKEITFQGVKMEKLSDEEIGLIGLLWQEQLKLYYIQVSAAPQQEVDLEILSQAALAAAKAILEGP